MWRLRLGNFTPAVVKRECPGVAYGVLNSEQVVSAVVV